MAETGDSTMPLDPQTRRERLRELAGLFLKLGTTAFGGPAAHIAMFEDEVVRRRKWITHQEFLDLLSFVNFIPGPNSTEMAVHIGLKRAGWRGLIVAGACFILPAAVMVTAIAWAYTEFSGFKVTTGILRGVQPVVIAVICQALWRLGKTTLKSWAMAALALLAAAANWMGVHELIVLAAAGVIVAAGRGALRKKELAGLVPPLWPLGQATAAGAGATTAAVALAPAALWPMFLTFLKIGSVLFGSGYVLLAFLRSDFVDRLHWLTAQQLVDAVAVGQVTPGPVFTTATFIGYVLFGRRGVGQGIAGAALATLGIFLPAFVFVGLSGRLMPWLRKSKLAAAFLDGLNVASLALMAVVTVQLAQATLITSENRVDLLALTVAAVSATLLLWKKVNSTWLVLGGAAVGTILAFAHV